jgi:hypothetical protein
MGATWFDVENRALQDVGMRNMPEHARRFLQTMIARTRKNSE